MNVIKMWFIGIVYVVTCMLVSVTVSEKPIQGAIGFPEVEENPKFMNKENRTPVFLPSMCQENELFYPGDQKDDWICDCRPGYLYHPSTNACWPAYRQGPCEEGHYLVLPKDSPSPKCYINPCMVDNYVIWNGRCEVLGSMAPCGTTFPPNVLWVNSTNILLSCVRLNLDQNVPDVARSASDLTCPPGCKRSIQNKCVPGT